MTGDTTSKQPPGGQRKAIREPRATSKARKPRKKRPRTPLSRAQIVAAAVALADAAGGVSGLSMRKLASALGVEAMSLYNHVANKDAILDAMVDHVFAEVGPPDMQAPWRAAMFDRAVRLRAVLSRHRWAVGLLDSRAAPGPATLAHHNAVLGTLRTSGFSVVEAAHAFSVMDSYIYGFCMQEQAMPFEDDADFDALAEAMAAQLDADTYPHMVELIVEHTMKPGYAYANEFPVGLDLVLDGLAARLAAQA